MPGKKKDSKIEPVVTNKQGNKCPQEKSENCEVPGVYGDSSPIGGG